MLPASGITVFDNENRPETKSARRMRPPERLDRIRVAFADHRLVAHVGLLLPVTLTQHLGMGELVDRHVDPGRTPGRANAGDKMLTLVASALAGGVCIDDAGPDNTAPSHRWIRANPAQKAPIETLKTPVDAPKTPHRDRPNLWFLPPVPALTTTLPVTGRLHVSEPPGMYNGRNRNVVNEFGRLASRCNGNSQFVSAGPCGFCRALLASDCSAATPPVDAASPTPASLARHDPVAATPLRFS